MGCGSSVQAPKTNDPFEKLPRGEFSTSSTNYPSIISSLRRQPCYHCQDDHTNHLNVYHFLKHNKLKVYGQSNPVMCPKTVENAHGIPWKDWHEWVDNLPGDVKWAKRPTERERKKKAVDMGENRRVRIKYKPEIRYTDEFLVEKVEEKKSPRKIKRKKNKSIGKTYSSIYGLNYAPRKSPRRKRSPSPKKRKKKKKKTSKNEITNKKNV